VATDFVRVQRRVKFGDGFELDPAGYELRRAGIPLKLEPTPFGILSLLIEQRGQLVSRQEIVERIWGKGVFLDTDNSINGGIRKIRQALNDDPENPRFIQTVTGRGYRFIAPLENVEKQSPQTEPAHEQPRSRTIVATTITESVVADGSTVSDRRGLWSRSGVMVLVLLWAVGVGGWLTWKRFNGERHAVRSMAVLPLQNLSGDPSQEYFADGMTEELITNLGKIADLRVISHTSVTRYKNTKKPLSEIAKELQVEAVVEGTVARSGDQCALLPT
jgi:DNA-binding winged helix-turn-helix (wHTH) protein